MRVYLCQLDIQWENKKENFRKIEDLLTSASVNENSLFVLPELCSTGFSMNAKEVAEEKNGITFKFLSELAKGRNIWIAAGLGGYDSQGMGLNQATVIGPDGIERGRYTKNYPFSLSNEGQFYRQSSDVLVVDCCDFKLAPIICYDLRFPELFRAAQNKGAELFVVIANWPIKRVDHWVTLLQARAIENQAWVVGVNRAGKDPNHTYPGRSLVVDPQGVIRSQMNEAQGIAQCFLSREELDQWRAEFPAIKDRKNI